MKRIKFIKFKGINIHNHIPMIDGKKVIKTIREAGLKHPIIWGDCYKRCGHKGSNDRLDIGLDYFHPHLLKMLFFLFIDKYFPNFRRNKVIEGLSKGLCTTYDNLPAKISLNFMFCAIQDISPILKHELLHIEYGSHCTNKKCLFFAEDVENSSFCKKCQRKYDNLIKELNKYQVRGY